MNEKMLASQRHISEPGNGYYRVEEGELHAEVGEVSTFARSSHDAFRNKVLNPSFPA
jgi:hypothetical protein